jgi:hypothetical protein
MREGEGVTEREKERENCNMQEIMSLLLNV